MQLNSSPPLPEKLVEVRGLHRAFDKVHAVQDVNFHILRGQVVGFIGANGAGKTTTMRIMATLDSPSSGSVIIGGEDVMQHPERVRRLIGWMPDSFGTYAYMTVFEYLDFFARAYGFKAKERAARVNEVMDFADLTPLAERPMNKLSKGMGQRLCFGRMLLSDPEFMILDEPAAGLDPKARMEFKNLVRLLAQRGKTLFISSHILSELGEMCDTLLFIDSRENRLSRRSGPAPSRRRERCRWQGADRGRCRGRGRSRIARAMGRDESGLEGAGTKARGRPPGARILRSRRPCRRPAQDDSRRRPGHRVPPGGPQA